MVMRPAAAAFLHEPFARQEIAGSAHGRPARGRHLAMARHEPVEQFPRAPIRMMASSVTQERGNHGIHAMRTGVRRATFVTQAAATFLLEPVEPLVARLSTDAVPGAELRHVVEALPVIGNEVLTLFHGCGLQPRHRPTSPTKGWPCSLEGVAEVSPMFPV
jgi:hypothetical protein